MRQLVSCLIAMTMILLSWSNAEAQHYYGGGMAIPLNVDSTLVTVKFDDDFGTHAGQMLLESIDRVVDVIADDHAIDGFFVCSVSTGEGYGDFLDSITVIDGVYAAEPYYRNQSDRAVILTFHLTTSCGMSTFVM